MGRRRGEEDVSSIMEPAQRSRSQSRAAVMSGNIRFLFLLVRAFVATVVCTSLRVVLEVCVCGGLRPT
eukprot:8079485-Pyramimonas_sp.AAC.1